MDDLDTKVRKHFCPRGSRQYCPPILVLLLVLSSFIAACGKQESGYASNKATPPAIPESDSTGERKSEYKLKELFERVPTAVLTIANQDQFAQVKALRNVRLVPEAKGLEIDATTNDPAVLLPEVSGDDVVIAVTLESPVETTVQLFYLRPGEKSYNESQSQKLHLNQGKNVVYFELTGPARIGALRLDPGMAPGTYLLESFVAKVISPAGNRGS